MANIRILPPPTGTKPSITLSGRTYTCALASFLDVPDFDASPAAANGWTIVAPNGVGTTAQRPTPATSGMRYMDTTLGFIVIHEGLVWRNPASGAAV